MILPAAGGSVIGGCTTTYLIPHVSDERGRGNPAPAQKTDAAPTSIVASWRMKTRLRTVSKSPPTPRNSRGFSPLCLVLGSLDVRM